MDAGAALKRQCPESPPNMVASFFHTSQPLLRLAKNNSDVCSICHMARAGAGHRQLSASFPGNGIPPRRDRWPKIGSGREKSPRRPNRIRQSPPIAGLWLVSGKSSGSKDCVVGPGDVPLVCDFKQLRCPTALNTHAERKRQFGPLSNLSPNIELRPGRGRIRKIDGGP